MNVVSVVRSGFFAFSMGLFTLGCTGGGDQDAEATTDGLLSEAEAEQEFFSNFMELCGNTYGGRTVLAPVDDDVFEPARLFFVVESCESDEIRMPFVVDGDASRTWVLTLGDEGLRFTHEHRREDGTEYDGSGFGGYSDGAGSPWFQSFPNYRAEEGTPYEELGIWRLRIDHDNDQFVYYLDRGDEPRYRLVFHLGPPSPPLR